MKAEQPRIALVALLSVNTLYLIARSFIGDEPRVPLYWSIMIVIAYAAIVAFTIIRGRVVSVPAKIVIWISFALMVLTAIGDPETPEPKNYGSLVQYAELAWAAAFCIGSLYLITRLARISSGRT